MCFHTDMLFDEIIIRHEFLIGMYTPNPLYSMEALVLGPGPWDQLSGLQRIAVAERERHCHKPS